LRAGAAVCSRKPFLKRRGRDFSYLMRPVPRFFRRISFLPQLKERLRALGYPQAAQTFFWMWKEVLPQRLHMVCVFWICFFRAFLVPMATDYLRTQTTSQTVSTAASRRKTCAACGYPSARNRRYNWCKKMIRRKNRGTGRMRYEKDLPRKFKNGFREQTQAPSRNKSATA